MAALSNTQDLEGGLDAYSGGATIACAIVFIVAGTSLLCLRFLSVILIQRQKPSFFEDWILIPAWVILMAQCGSTIVSVTAGGVGRHQAWVVKNAPSMMRVWAQTMFVSEFTYSSVIALVKTSILLLYVRIFRLHRWFRLVCYGLIAIVWAWAAALIFVAIFQCDPIALIWDKTLEGHCIDQLIFYRAIAVPNVIHDAVMLLLPLPMIWQLQVELRKKLSLSVVFAIGTLGLVASAIRTSEFFKLDAFSDSTWAAEPLMSWTLAEPGVIFVCACLPSLWSLISRRLSRGVISSTGISSNASTTTGRRSIPNRPTNNFSKGPRSVENSSYTSDSFPLKKLDTQAALYDIESINPKQADFDEVRTQLPVSTHGILVTKEVTLLSRTNTPTGKL